MEQMMTIKTKQVMDYLISCKHSTIESLATNLNMTQRQIRYHLNLINQYMKKEIVSVDYKGGVFLKDFKISEQSDFFSSYKFTKKERIKGIYILLAFRTSELNLTFLSKKMNVARTTIKNDLKEVEKKLEVFQLLLQYDKKYYISGDDKDIFTFQVYCIPILFEFYDLIDAYDLQQFKEIDILSIKRRKEIQKLEHLIMQYVSCEYKTLKGKRLIRLSHIVLTMIYYYENHMVFPFFKYQLPYKHSEYFEEFVKKVESNLGLFLSAEQKNQIASVISFMYIHDDHNKYQDLKEHTIIFLYGLISYIEKMTSFILYEDVELLNALFYHVMLTYTQGTSFKISKEMKKSIQISLTIKKLIEDYCMICHERLDEDEILFLQLHILNSFRKLKKEDKKKVLLVTSASNYIVQSLCYDLESIFYIDVVQQVTPYELTDDLQKYDGVLFTEDIPLSYRHLNNVTKVNFILTQEDFKNLKNLQFDIHHYSLDLKQLDDLLYFLNDEEKQKAIVTFHHFLEQNHISSYYSKGILDHFQRVEVSYIDPKICSIEIHKGLKAGFIIEDNKNNQLEVAFDGNDQYCILKSNNAGLLLRGLLEMRRL